MRKKNEQKGITLVALVVTIIILIILASVSISLVLGEHGLLKMARDGRDNYLIAANEEQAQLGQLEDQWDELINGNGNQGATWSYNHANQTVTATINGKTVTMKIGDKVNDTSTQTVEGFDGKCRVLGVENGQLLLVSDTYYAPFAEDATNGIVRSSSGSVGPDLYGLSLSGKDGWDNGVDRLNKIGEQYNNSKLEKARSIKIEDIDKITGYNPNNTGVNDQERSGTGTKYGQGKVEQYGNKVTYKIISGKVNWSTNYDSNNPEAATWNATTMTKFKPLGVDTWLTEGQIYTVNKSDSYYYYVTTLTENSSDSTAEGIDANGAVYDMLFKVSYAPYWLASPYISASDKVAGWGFRFLISGGVVYGGIWYSNEGSHSSTNGVRPVVSLKSDIEPSLVSTDADTGISTYSI